MENPSYVHGAVQTPLIGRTIGDYFDAVVAQSPEGLALVVRHQDIRWTWSELKRRVDAFAAGLLAMGLHPGDRLGLWAPNCAEWTITQFATAKIGVVLVNINPAYRLTEVEYALNKVGCRVLVTAVRHKGSEYLDMIRELIDAGRAPLIEHVITLGAQSYPECRRFEDVAGTEVRAVAEIGASLQFDDPINIQFTSGTTGYPKGATLSHHNILNNGYFVGEAIGLKAHDKLCIPVPLYHCFGMVMGNLGCLTHSATMVYPAESFDPGAVLETIHSERCTALYGVPTMFISLISQGDRERYDLSCLRTGIMAGSPCPVEVMRQVIDRLHLPEVTIAYGMTETSPVSFQSSVTDSLERRVTTVGRIQPHLEVKIIDGQGRVVPRGQSGELCTRGYSVMLGYWNDAERTAEAIDRAGWMHTGDLATLDAEGYCNIVGRIKDMVIRGGENIYPREVEEFLYRHPFIRDVQVVGVPDPKFGEELCAVVIVRDGKTIDAEELARFCRGRIAHYKIPRYVKIVTQFPTTVTGKIKKYELRDMLVRELGVSESKTA